MEVVPLEGLEGKKSVASKRGRILMGNSQLSNGEGGKVILRPQQKRYYGGYGLFSVTTQS